ncbi:MAG: hypothetical protein AB7E73_04300 [Burkholderiales bacterium]
MGFLFTALMTIGPLSLLIGLISVPVYYLVYRAAPEPKRGLPLLRYALGTLVAGALGFFAGTALGILAGCFVAQAGNLCGLMGVLGLGPLFCGVAMAVRAHVLVRNAARS